MPVFGYRGLAADGRAVSGVIDADSARGARGKLRGIGIFPTAINEEVAVAERRTLSERMPGLRRKMPATARTIRLPGGPAIPIAALAICALFLSAAEKKNWIAGGIALAIGAAIYAARRGKETPGERTLA